MQCCLDPVVGQIEPHSVSSSFGDAHYVLVPNLVRDLRSYLRFDDKGMADHIVVGDRAFKPSGVDIARISELDPQHRGLQRVEATVEADILVVILGCFPVIGERAHRVGDSFGMGHYNSAVAERPYAFGRIEAESTRVDQRSGVS